MNIIFLAKTEKGTHWVPYDFFKFHSYQPPEPWLLGENSGFGTGGISPDANALKGTKVITRLKINITKDNFFFMLKPPRKSS